MEINPCTYVKQSSEKVVAAAVHVKINPAKLKELAEQFKKEATTANFESWGKCHFPPESCPLESLLRYVFVIDTLNYCFWPNPPFEYDSLAGNLYHQLASNPKFFDMDQLSSITSSALKEHVFKTKKEEFCLLEERARMIREVFGCIVKRYKGSCTEFVKAAGGNAVALVRQVTDSFPCFRDQAIFRGCQVFFYKRAQILVSDLHLAYADIKNAKIPDASPYKILEFGESIKELTMFADYRVPQLLRAKGVLEYSKELAEKVDHGVLLDHGSPFEVEIRAATIVAVERMKDLLEKMGSPALSVEIDVCLWQIGEKLKEEILPPHHTLSIFY